MDAADPPLTPAARRYSQAVDHLLAHRRGTPTYNELTDRVLAGLGVCEVKACEWCGEQWVDPPYENRRGRPPKRFCSKRCTDQLRRAA